MVSLAILNARNRLLLAEQITHEFCGSIPLTQTADLFQIASGTVFEVFSLSSIFICVRL